MVGVVEYYGVDEEDEGVGSRGVKENEGAGVAYGVDRGRDRDMRTPAMMKGYCTTWNPQKKVSVILTSKASNTLGAVREALIV